MTTGKTLKETELNIREAIAFHLEFLREHNEPIPEATSTAALVEVDFPATRV